MIRDGWYVTGDMGRFDEDGYITLTGRLSRFAKVGGEMVPLERIEEELHAILQHQRARLCRDLRAGRGPRRAAGGAARAAGGAGSAAVVPAAGQPRPAQPVGAGGARLHSPCRNCRCWAAARST